MEAKLSDKKTLELKLALERRYELYKILEPSVTDLLIVLSEKYRFTLASLEHKFKTIESSTRKIKQMLYDLYGENPSDEQVKVDELVEMVDDYLRYTLIFDENDFTNGVTNVIKELKQNSFVVKKLHNRFNDNKYKDVISWYTSNNSIEINYTFELQFHTQDSYDAKQVNHYIYEIVRKYRIELNQIDNEITELLDCALEALYKKVKKPKNVENIESIK